MTAHIDPQPVGGATTPDGLKASVLLSHDLAMLATATKYNLDDKASRTRSNKALVRLFFGLAEVFDIDLFVEAGAKEASASRRAKTAFTTARVVAFEANPYNHRRYARVNADAGIEYHHRALTDRSGPVTFNVLRDDDGAPLVNGRSSLLKREKVGDDERGFEEVTVDGTTLDGFFADHEFSRAAMWIDVEGASGMVLSGASQLLARTAVLIIEVEELQWWGESHWLREQVVSHLYDLGFVPIARDFEFRFQHNIVLVRSDLVAHPRARLMLSRFISQAFTPPVPAPPPPPAAPAPAPAPPTPGARARRLARRVARRARRMWRTAAGR